MKQTDTIKVQWAQLLSPQGEGFQGWWVMRNGQPMHGKPFATKAEAQAHYEGLSEQLHGVILQQGPRLTFRSWVQVQKYIDAHVGEIPEYKVMRWNMSNRGALIDVATGKSVADTVTLAEEIIKFR